MADLKNQPAGQTVPDAPKVEPTSDPSDARMVADALVTPAAAQGDAAPGVLAVKSLFGTGKPDFSAAVATAGGLTKGAATPWQSGIEVFKTAYGSTLTEDAIDLVRRTLGELYIESQGGMPASALAHDIADHLAKPASQATADYLVERGKVHAAGEGVGLNNRGYAMSGVGSNT